MALDANGDPIPVKRRWVAYDLTGDERGQVPESMGWEYTTLKNDLPTGSLIYPEDADRSDLLEQRIDAGVTYPTEVRFQWLEVSGVESFIETGYNSRLMVQSVTLDRLDPNKVASYQLIGVGDLMRKALVLPSAGEDDDDDPNDPADGPKPIEKKFKNRTVGYILKWIIDRAQADDGWFPDFGYTFGPANDSAGNPWPTITELVLPGNSHLLAAVQMFARRGYLNWAMQGYSLAAAAPGTLLERDETDKVLRLGQGPTKAPRTQTWVDMCTDAAGFTEDGKVVTDSNGLTLPAGLGQLWQAVDVSGTSDSDLAEATLARVLANGNGAREAITREVVWDDMEWQPNRDLKVGDQFTVETGGKNDDGSNKTLPQRIVGFRLAGSGGPTTGDITINSRQSDRVAKLERVIERLTQGSEVGDVGRVSRPGPTDPRKPDAPSAPGVSLSVELPEGRSRGMASITWTLVTTTTDTPSGASESITVPRYEIWRRRGTGKERLIARVASDYTQPYEDRDLRANTAYAYMIKALNRSDVASDLSSATAVTTGTDVDPKRSATLVYDSKFATQIIRDARAADAGAGLTFVATSGQYRARLTSAVTLETAVGETATAGRIEVTPTETYMLSCKAKRIGGTSVNVRGVVRWYDDTGATISSDVGFTTATTTTAALYESSASSPLTAPSTAAWASVRLTGTSFTGSPTLEIWEPRLDRQVAETRQGSDSVKARAIHSTDNLTSKHTSTGALLQAAAGSAGFKASPSGFFVYISATLMLDASATKVYVTGELETSSGAIFGGAGLLDIQFPSGAGYSIGENGGFLEYNAGGSGHKFNGAVLVGSALTVSGSTTFNGSRITNNGGADVNASGTTLGFYGASATTKLTVTGSRGGNAALASALTVLATLGLLVDGSSA